MEHIKQNCEDICRDDEPLFLNKCFKDECDHNREETRAENLKSRVPFEKKFDLSISTFDEPINDQAFYNTLQGPRIDQSIEIFFEDELMSLDGSNRDVLVSYTPLKEIIDLNLR